MSNYLIDTNHASKLMFRDPVLIARIENGGVMPTIDSLDRIGQALGAELAVRFEPRPPRPGGRP